MALSPMTIMSPSGLPSVENLTYQCALQNELLKRNVTEIPVMAEPSLPLCIHYCLVSLLLCSSISSQLLLSPRRITRKIPKAPFKVLDAPELQDDFYLNLLDWSSLNLLAVGLGSAVYLWNACTCQASPSHMPTYPRMSKDTLLYGTR